MDRYIVLLFLLLVLPAITGAQPPCIPTVTMQPPVVIAWDLIPQPEGVVLTAYLLERQDIDSITGTTHITLLSPGPAIAGSTYMDTALSDGHSYTWWLRVQGTLADGTTAVSGYAANSLTSPPCAQIALPATTPLKFQAMPLPQAIRLTWESPNPEALVHLERRQQNRMLYTWWVDVTGTAYTDALLSTHTTYCYRARFASQSLYTPTVCARAQK
jgi:hypothetical protein